MKGKFVIILDGKLTTYTDYDDIPKTFDNLIEYAPWIPDELREHTEEEHAYLETLNDGLIELMKREMK